MCRPLNVLSLGSLKIRMRGYRQLFILPYQLAQSPFKSNENRVIVTGWTFGGSTGYGDKLIV